MFISYTEGPRADFVLGSFRTFLITLKLFINRFSAGEYKNFQLATSLKGQ
jgi:hypothetical protein